MKDEPHGQSYYNKAFSHTNDQGKPGDFSMTCQNYKCSPAVAEHFSLSSTLEKWGLSVYIRQYLCNVPGSSICNSSKMDTPNTNP